MKNISIVIFVSLFWSCNSVSTEKQKISTKDVEKVTENHVGIQHISFPDGIGSETLEYDSLGVQIKNHYIYAIDSLVAKYYYYDLENNLRFKRIFKRDTTFNDSGKPIYVGFNSEKKNRLKINETINFLVFIADVPRTKKKFDLQMINKGELIKLVNDRVMIKEEVLSVPMVFDNSGEVKLLFISKIHKEESMVIDRLDTAFIELSIL